MEEYRLASALRLDGKPENCPARLEVLQMPVCSEQKRCLCDCYCLLCLMANPKRRSRSAEHWYAAVCSCKSMASLAISNTPRDGGTVLNDRACESSQSARLISSDTVPMNYQFFYWRLFGPKLFRQDRFFAEGDRWFSDKNLRSTSRMT